MSFIKKITNLFHRDTVSQKNLNEIEKLLIQADISPEISQNIMQKISKLPSTSTELKIKSTISDVLLDILIDNPRDLSIDKDKLNICIFSGVNGSGKTSSLAKLSQFFQKRYKLAIAACDTFRAAALEQLKRSIEKSNSGSKIDLYQVSEKYRDPSSLAYHAISESLKKNTNILLIDTAGRLHNNVNLMEELKKMVKIVKKFEKNIKLHNFMVLDATIGQNAINQVREFKNIIDINGIILTKMDSSSKAGAILAIQKKFSIPIYFITFGEKLEDIKNFDHTEFIDNVLDLK